MKYQVQAIWNNSSNSHRLGQEEGMDEDTAVWKEGVRPLMEAQKGKNNILFERLFSRNKKINALTEVKEDQYLKEGVCISGRRINFL